MISTIVQKRTFEKIVSGDRVIFFRHKQHWDRRFAAAMPHRSIVLLSGRRCKAFSIETVKDTGGSFEVHLGVELTFWAEQKQLFPTGRPNSLFVPGAVCI